ncbi:hypothetical protein EV385_0481 [Krasilnikovia cinnamomea]|uniref:Endonuclease/exonuclease/phosphatase family protein n=1 Tax=Krasilnikovia cinnamomea TaxID=349313 RepID=A0A4Q7ZDK4_9ACTN|nr:hypothetical protein EV385_0481 [Krasilnikovia cinnamomea]
MFTVKPLNVENQFRSGQPGGPNTAAAYDAKLRGLAGLINDHAPDVVAVQDLRSP